MSETKTIREMIAERRDRILSTKPLSKNELADIGIDLSTLLINVGDKKVEMESKCYRLKEDWLVTDPKMSDARAETRMKASSEWLRFRKTKILYDGTLELIRAIKVKIKDTDTEFENI